MEINFKKQEYLSVIKRNKEYFILRHLLRFLKKKKCYDKFFTNLQHQKKDIIFGFLTRREVISDAFTWAYTPEEDDFWWPIYAEWVNEHEKLSEKFKKM